MNGLTWDLPAGISCPIQSEICSKCYARKGHFTRPNAKNLRYHNFYELADKGYINWKLWIINKLEEISPKYFRWHSSGDVFCKQYLNAIYEVCKVLPETSFWLPSHNYRVFTEKPPKNLQVHLSCMKDTKQEEECRKKMGTRIKLAYMFVNKAPRRTHICPCSGKAPDRPRNCDQANCRTCWNKDRNVAFYYH